MTEMRSTACKWQGLWQLSYVELRIVVADGCCSRWDLNCSTLYPGNLRFRKMSVSPPSTAYIRPHH